MDLDTYAVNDFSWSDTLRAAGGFVDSAANAYFGVQQKQLQLDQAQAAIDLSRIQTGAAVDIAKMQAQAAANQARYAAGYGSGYSNFDQGMANISARLNNLTGGNSIMLWLTVAGVAIAFLQLQKRKG